MFGARALQDNTAYCPSLLPLLAALFCYEHRRIRCITVYGAGQGVVEAALMVSAAFAKGRLSPYNTPIVCFLRSIYRRPTGRDYGDGTLLPKPRYLGRARIRIVKLEVADIRRFDYPPGRWPAYSSSVYTSGTVSGTVVFALQLY